MHINYEKKTLYILLKQLTDRLLLKIKLSWLVLRASVMEMERSSLRKRRSRTGPKWDPAQGEVPRPDTILRTWSTHKKGPSMTALRKTQQAAERVRCRCLQPNQWTEAADPCC